MATATMGLRRRVQVSSSSVASTSSGSTGTGNKRTRSENNNSPSQGNLNASSEPAPKKTRTSKSRTRDAEKKAQVTPGPPHWSDPRPYASIAGLSLGAQAALCAAEAAVGALPAAIPYMSQTMATFVGTAAASLGKAAGVGGAGGGAPVSYLDISNMTAGTRPPPSAAAAVAAAAAAAAAAGWPDSEAKGPMALPYPAAPSAPFTVTSAKSSPSTPTPAAQSEPSNAAASSATTVPKNFPNDSMFNTYQPWVIKTYGDLAKTKTITIKKYARILRTLRGEEVNSAENSKFRFWVKSKGFHIGQPEGYEAKPADGIVGRHAVSQPGLDPPLYVPTQPPHNKALNGAEGTVPPGRVYKKVAIVENFFDIIHAVHVDLEGRPGKHAGQKRTYRTITETYAFLPREAVTRFLLGCTECQRRPRTPSPTSLTTSTTAAPSSKPSTPTPVPAASPTPPPAVTVASNSGPTTTTTTTPSSPKPATTLAAANTVEQSVNGSDEKPMEASHAPEIKVVVDDTLKVKEEPVQNIKEEPDVEVVTTTESTAAAVVTTVATTTTASTSQDNKTWNDTSSCISVVNKSKLRDEKYNPLSITNLLRKDPPVIRRPIPIITSAIPYYAQPETLTTTSMIGPMMTPMTMSVGPVTTCLSTESPMTTCPATIATTAETTSTRSISPSTSTSAAVPRKLRMLPDDHVRRSTPSPLAVASLPQPWSPSVDPKYTPIDYSLPITTSYLKHHQRVADHAAADAARREADKSAAASVAATMTAAQAPLFTTVTTTTTGSTNGHIDLTESNSESDNDVALLTDAGTAAPTTERSFSPAAGLIDTNLNLLATIQQLHCQVMLALTERLRASPIPGNGSSSPAPAAAQTAVSHDS